MRAFLLASLLSILTLFPSSGNAKERHLKISVSDIGVLNSEKAQSANPNSEIYRGYFVDLRAIPEQNAAKIVDALRHQIDIVESVGLSQRVRQFFHRVPILVDEFACLSTMPDTELDANKKPVLAAACYSQSPPKSQGISVWNSEKQQWTSELADIVGYSNIGGVMVRPRPLDPQRPVLLHEMLHAYHATIMSQGVRDPSILFYYEQAKGRYSAEAYLMTNEREFFAVSASVLLSGMPDGGITQEDIKEKQPDYFKFLTWLFELDPTRPQSGTPVASAN